MTKPVLSNNFFNKP